MSHRKPSNIEKTHPTSYQLLPDPTHDWRGQPCADMQRLGIIVEVLCDIPWPNRLGISLTGKNRNQVHVPVFQCKTNPISNPLSQFNIEKTHPTLYQSIRGNHCVKCIENY